MSKKIPQNLDLYIPFEKLIGNGFLELITIEHKEILRLKSPFTVKIEPTVAGKILDSLSLALERGGILAGKPIIDGNENVLLVEDAIFIKNISGNPRNSYLPYQPDWKKAMNKVLFVDKLLPIEFHSHPISNRKPGYKHLEYFNQMGASQNDQFLAEPVIQIGNYQIAIPQAILIKEIQTSLGFFVGIYGGLIAPKDFEPEIMKAGGEKAYELAKVIFNYFQKLMSDSKKKRITQILGFGAGISLLLFPQFLVFLLLAGYFSIWRFIPIMESIRGEEMPYFGIATTSKTLKIKIPIFNLANYSLNQLTVIKLKERKLKIPKNLKAD